jgi:hypothetical protein
VQFVSCSCPQIANQKIANRKSFRVHHSIQRCVLSLFLSLSVNSVASCKKIRGLSTLNPKPALHHSALCLTLISLFSLFASHVKIPSNLGPLVLPLMLPLVRFAGFCSLLHTISFIVPAHNEEAWVGRCVSAFGNTYPPSLGGRGQGSDSGQLDGQGWVPYIKIGRTILLLLHVDHTIRTSFIW